MLMTNVRRFWRWFRCDHRNALESMNFDGWNITACRCCGRAWMHTDGADASRERENARRRIDGEPLIPRIVNPPVKP